MYLIICDNKPDKVVQECCRRERGKPLPDFIARCESRCIIRLTRKLVFRSPTIIYDGLVVLLSVPLEKMVSEVRVPGVFPVEIIADTPWELEPINDAMSFAASLLEGGVCEKGCAHMHNLQVLFFSSTLVGLMDTVSVKKWIMSWATFGCGGGGGGSRAGVPTGERFGGGPDMSDTSSSSSLIPSRLNSSSLGSS